MPSSSLRAVTLVCHPETPSAALRGVAASVRRLAEGALAVSYALDGDLDRLRVPAPRVPRFADGLWRHTCCEIFIARKGEPAYHEFNLSPSGEWAAYAFERYRAAAPRSGASAAPAPEIATRRAPSTLEIDAVIRLTDLSPGHAGAELALALSVVAEERDGRLSYWALRHPRGKPDFHHADAFALALAA